MTTMTLTIDDKSNDILEALTIIISKFKGVSFEIMKDETEEKTLTSFRELIKEVKKGDAIENSISSLDFLAEIND